MAKVLNGPIAQKLPQHHLYETSGHTWSLSYQPCHQSEAIKVRRSKYRFQMQILIKRCLLKDFSVVLDNLWDIKATTKATIFWSSQIKVGPQLKRKVVSRVSFPQSNIDRILLHFTYHIFNSS